jgi:hypothetical protein
MKLDKEGNRAFWMDVYPDGWTAERLENEMHDYMQLLDGLDVLYMHITNGQCSKPMTSKSVVMALHDDAVTEIVDQAIKDHFDDRYGFNEDLRKLTISVLSEKVVSLKGKNGTEFTQAQLCKIIDLLDV